MFELKPLSKDAVPAAPARAIHVVENWFEELKARVGN